MSAALGVGVEMGRESLAEPLVVPEQGERGSRGHRACLYCGGEGVGSISIQG